MLRTKVKKSQRMRSGELRNHPFHRITECTMNRPGLNAGALLIL
jgi:hypothetical protein